MPSPKAVLRDIHDLKLDPKKAHGAIRASGRLRGNVSAVMPVADVPMQPVAIDVKPALISSELDEQVSTETETIVDEKEQTIAKKGGKFTKKLDKKEKMSDDPQGS